ncbi:MAG TPA: sugar transferase [Planctomycetota bacterium]|nr:sugar transferase [Planctomycetota bacterium]
MLSQHRRAFANTVLALDLVVVSAAIAFAAPSDTVRPWVLAGELAAGAFVWSTLSSRMGLYVSRRTSSMLSEIYLLAQVLLMVAGVVLVVRTAAQHPVPLNLLWLFGVGMGGTAGLRLFVRPLLRAARKRGWNTRNYLFIGRGESAHRMAEAILRRRDYGIHIVGELAFSGEETRPPIAGVEHLGTTADLQDVLKRHAVDEIVVCPTDGVWATEVKSLLRFCQTTGLSWRLAPDCFGIPADRSSVDYIGDVATYAMAGGFGERRLLWVKRAIDLVGSAVGLVLLAPLMLTIALAIWITSGRPILFKQVRVGVNGRLFHMFKFRSMVKNAEELRHQLEAGNEQTGPVFKMKHDPRVTPIGRFLRRYSLDELPQLFNVLLGDMSLVGPRPPIPSEVMQYDWWQRRRLSVRPGLTCTWQVSGRNAIGFDKWMEMDLAYIDGWNLALDMKIMAKTVKEVMRGGGA